MFRSHFALTSNQQPIQPSMLLKTEQHNTTEKKYSMKNTQLGNDIDEGIIHIATRLKCLLLQRSAKQKQQTKKILRVYFLSSSCVWCFLDWRTSVRWRRGAAAQVKWVARPPPTARLLPASLNTIRGILYYYYVYLWAYIGWRRYSNPSTIRADKQNKQPVILYPKVFFLLWYAFRLRCCGWFGEWMMEQKTLV